VVSSYSISIMLEIQNEGMEKVEMLRELGNNSLAVTSGRQM